MEIPTASTCTQAEARPDPVPTFPDPSDQPITLQEVFAKEESPLLRYAYGIVGQRETAEDLVQEVFLRLHTHWDEVTNPRAWLFRSVRNLALNHLRKSRSQTALDSQPELPSAEPDPEQALGQLEAIGSLQFLIAELPPQDQQLIRLKYQRKLKYDQISQQTGLSVGNVGYRLHHLLKNLADSLRKLGIESAEG
ncbi:MAG: sigma-70 family RNA polymerase sigma factor [Akkermansiaceae bacterium]|nr:sigma-70 family RNA polymerase sigma factor [Akkermansiaceae bacterium]